MRALKLVLLTLCLIGSPAVADATPSAEAEALFLDGVKKFKAGDVKGAIAVLEKAVAKDPHPTLLYNLAVLYDGEGNKAKAAEFYGRYLDTDPDDGGLVMARFQQLAPKQADAYVKAKDAASQPDAVASAGGPAAAGASGLGADKAEAGAGAIGAGPTTLSYILLGVGGAAMMAGAFFGQAMVNDLGAVAQASVRSDAQAAYDSAQSNGMMANVGFGVGSAALVGAIYMLISGYGAGAPVAAPAKAAPQPKAMITPMIGDGSGGAAVTLSF